MNNPPAETVRYRCAEEADAMQWTGTNSAQLRAFCGSDFDTIDPEDRGEDPDETAAVRSHKHGGWLGLSDGDWVVKHADHFSVASDEEFRARWSPAGLVAVPPTTDRDRIAEVLAEADGWRWAPGFKEQSPTWQRYQQVAATVLAVLPAGSEDTTTTRADAPVKQRADCTELEWAEQERARFERLYTRETVRADLAEKRADTAARDADIYQQRLERLGEGYTRERKRAEEAEAEAEQLRTDGAAVCICGHGEQQHFEDACLICDCGDYLVPEAAREVIARWREAAGKAERIRENADFHLGQEMARRQLAEKETARLAADRATVLNAAAQHLYTALFPAVYADMGQKAAEGVNRAVSELRRLAAETQPTEAPAHSCGNCEGIDPDTCLTNPDRADEDAPRREPHPTEADLRHALAVAAKFHGQDTDAPAASAGVQTDEETSRG